MTRLALLALAALLLAPAAVAQTSSDGTLDLSVVIAGYAHVVSLDDQDTADDATLTFEFAPGLSDTDPQDSTTPAAVSATDRITFATNFAQAHQVDVAVSAANAGDWNDLSITITPGSISTVNTSTSTDGTAGSCGTAGAASSALTADAANVAVASGVTLCHATQTVGYSVALDDITADEDDRDFDVVYTILATTAP